EGGERAEPAREPRHDVGVPARRAVRAPRRVGAERPGKLPEAPRGLPHLPLNDTAQNRRVNRVTTYVSRRRAPERVAVCAAIDRRSSLKRRASYLIGRQSSGSPHRARNRHACRSPHEGRAFRDQRSTTLTPEGRMGLSLSRFAAGMVTVDGSPSLTNRSAGFLSK